MNHLHMHGLYYYFKVKAQIKYMWYLEEFEMSAILCVTTFDTLCISNFLIKFLHCTMHLLKFWIKLL
jgi:hypothetical protein